MIEQFHSEIEALRKLHHPNIIKLYDVFTTDKKIYISMELMAGGELFDYVVVKKGTLTETEASVIVRMVTDALVCVHECNIIHWDLKPENLLLKHKLNSIYDLKVKIIDFGLSKVRSISLFFHHSRSNHLCQRMEHGIYIYIDSHEHIYTSFFHPMESDEEEFLQYEEDDLLLLSSLSKQSPVTSNYAGSSFSEKNNASISEGIQLHESDVVRFLALSSTVLNRYGYLRSALNSRYCIAVQDSRRSGWRTQDMGFSYTITHCADRTIIVYHIFYMGQRTCGFWSGAHEGDWERVAVELTSDYRDIYRVRYNQHAGWFTRVMGTFPFRKGR
jgi:hypothetical protein